MKQTFLAVILIVFSCQLLVAQQKKYISSNNGVNLREGAGTNYNVIKSIPAGAEVKVVSTEGDWAKVEYDNQTGYVSNQLLSEEKPKDSNSPSRKASSSNNRNNSSNNNNTANKKNNSTGRNNNSSSSASNRNWGIGLRVGDPVGLTVKKYNGNNAWEFNIGATTYWGGYSYRDAFYDYDYYQNYRSVEYKDHALQRAVSIQLRHLWHRDLNIDGLPGLQWYYGLGGQVKSVSVLYRYKYEDQWGNKDDNFYHTANFINLGVDGIIGLEYTFDGAPLSIFADYNLFLEIYNNPFLFHNQGGLGIRYNF